MNEYRQYRSYGSRVARAWVVLILGSIALAAAMYPWLKFYHAVHPWSGNYLETIKANVKIFGLYVGLVAVFLLFSIIANVKLSTTKRDWGRGFGIFFGRFVILLEYIGLALSVAFLFI